MTLDTCLAAVDSGFCINLSFIFVCIALGAAAGFLGGLLGIGGGIVIVPVLFSLFSASGIEATLALKMSLATSLATIIFTSLAAIRAQLKRQAIRWSIVKAWTPFILLGSFSTAFVTEYFSATLLRSFIGVFLLCAAIVMLIKWKPKPTRTLPGPIGTMITSFLAGFTSALAGIGGGNIIVPILTWFNVPMKNTAATSSTLGLPIALFGCAGFVVAGWSVGSLPTFHFGYVYLPAFALVATMTFLCAPLGVAAAHRLPSDKLKQFFGVLLLIVAVRMLW